MEKKMKKKLKKMDSISAKFVTLAIGGYISGGMEDWAYFGPP
jgi:hypothetical protein